MKAGFGPLFFKGIAPHLHGITSYTEGVIFPTTCWIPLVFYNFMVTETNFRGNQGQIIQDDCGKSSSPVNQ